MNKGLVNLECKTNRWRILGRCAVSMVLALLLLAGSVSPAVRAAPVTDVPPAAHRLVMADPHYVPAVAEAAEAIWASTLYRYVGDLSGEWPIEVNGEQVTLTTRYTYADEVITLAEQYALQHFRSLGLESECHAYEIGGLERCNIVAEQPGALEPQRVVLLTAHLDSTSNDTDPLEMAPGADDNASGSAAVMAAADVLSRYQLPYTVRYVLFTGEEQRLNGSAAYAQELAQREDEIIGVLNLDMIGYNSEEHPAPVIQIHTRDGVEGEADRILAQAFTDVVGTYGLNLVPEIVATGMSRSDHASFWAEGYAAVLVIEDGDDFNWGNYHSSTDRLEALDVAYHTAAARAAAATAMHLAGVVDIVHTPVLVTPGEPVVLSVVEHLTANDTVSYTWDLGDGDRAQGATVTHTFTYDSALLPWQGQAITLTVASETDALVITRRLPVRAWDIILPFIVRPLATQSEPMCWLRPST